MIVLQSTLTRRFTLTAAEITRVEFGRKRSGGIDIVNLSSTDSVFVLEDGLPTSVDSMSLELLPGMGYSFLQEFTSLNFLSAGTPTVQIMPR
jgi:hypothetical protein